MNGRAEWMEDIRWLEIKNAGGTAVPEYGLVRVTGVDADNELLEVQQPNAEGQDVLVNGPTQIPAGGYGSAYDDWLVDALYESGDGTPAVGEYWGAAASSYKLRKGRFGFQIVGGPTAGRVMARRLGRGLDVRKNSTGSVFRQPRLNLIEGSGISLTVAEDTTNGEVDVTVAASGSGVTVREQDGSPSYSSITTLTFDQADGFVVSEPAGGEARVDIAAASAGQAGVVTTAAQTFGGDKTFATVIATTLTGGLVTIDELAPDIDSVTLAADTHNLSAPCVILRVNQSGGSWNLTGIEAPAATKLLFLWNESASTLTLKHQDGSSTAGNRFIVPGGADLSVAAGQMVLLFYDPTTADWIPAVRMSA
jgi:hypothetical protein